MFVVSYAMAKGMSWWINGMEERVAACARPDCSSCKTLKEATQAEAKAYKLFVSLLTPQQQTEMKTSAQIREIGNKTGHIYIINLRTLVSNILVFDATEGRYISRLCVFMLGPGASNGRGIPPSDHFIAQLLYIRYNEAALLRKAIVTY